MPRKSTGMSEGCRYPISKFNIIPNGKWFNFPFPIIVYLLLMNFNSIPRDFQNLDRSKKAREKFDACMINQKMGQK